MYSSVAPRAVTTFRQVPSSRTSEAGGQSRTLRLPPIKLQKPPTFGAVSQQPTGLRTPPWEEMGTTYQAPNVAPYESHIHASIPGYSASMAQADRTRSVLGGVHAPLDGYPRYAYPHQQAPPHQQRQSRPQALGAHQSQQTLHHSQHHLQQSQQPQQEPQQQQPPPQPYAYQQQQVQVPAPNSRPVISSASQALSSQQTSTVSSGPATPKSGRSMASQASISRKDVASLAGQSLEIPACISPKGGSLSDFSAQLTCFFWFETRKVHQLAVRTETPASSEPIRSLTRDAIPSQNFKNWVHGILSTTQVTQNVILLALLFINRLKVGNPNVKGRAGSEYRLLTVALMLGNKFLDDNTYTNKTWAEVSGITVQEIHVMEVEFLSNMRYSLLVTKEQWEEWLVRLARIWEYCEAAMRPVPSPLVIPSPAHYPASSPIPSPTGHQLLTPSMHTTPTASTYSPSYAYPPRTLSSSGPWPTAAGSLTAQSLSPLAARPDGRNGSGKRPYGDDDPTEPPAKRIVRQPPQPMSAQSMSLHGQARQPGVVPQEPLRLPVPNLTLNTAPPAPAAAPQGYMQTANHAPAQQSALSLPPLVPGVRAMATVYPPTSSTNYSPGGLVPSNPALPSSVSTPHAATAPLGYPPSTNYGTPTKRHSPGSLRPAAAAALGNPSPLTESFPHGHASGIHTPISHSPSVYLQHRSSPYRPVRHVNTLLYPPPSASLHEYHLSGAGIIPPTQMHYQPLGRRHEFRTGIVPEFTSMAQQQQHEQQHHFARQGASLTPVSRPVLASQEYQQHPHPHQLPMLGQTPGQGQQQGQQPPLHYHN